MFDVILQRNSSENNKVTKSITNLVTYSGTLKDKTSIIDPVIIVEGDLTSFVKANYMTISTFGRSYFITDIQSVGNNLFEVSGHVDVISTYATEIKRNSAIVKRQKGAYNLYLNDGSLKVYQDPKVVIKTFGSGFTTMEFVMAVAGS